MGVRLMKYRADVIGADFSIGRRKSHGTRITCVLRMAAVVQPPAFSAPLPQHNG